MTMRKIQINSEIFSEKTVKQALRDYGNIAKTSLKNKGEYFIVTFWKCKFDEEQTLREFENYMIGLENS